MKAATPADEQAIWQVEGRTIGVDMRRDVVLPTTKPHPDNPTFDVYIFHDSAFKQPWLLATPLKLTFASVHALYSDRWPVEQIPLTAKQMLGDHRQFVHNPDSVQRLPELTLLAGSILSFLAATCPPRPAGFWDRRPKPTPGRFRRALMGQAFPKDAPLSGQLREKHSVTAHLPKGHLVRSPKMARKVPLSVPLVT